MFRKIASLFIVLMILYQPFLYAAPVSTHPTQLIDVRWACHPDPETGGSKVRLVVDVTGSVEAAGELHSTPTPRIIVNIKGTEKGNIPSSLKADGSIVDTVKFSQMQNGMTEMVIELAQLVKSTDYRVFTLKQDPENKRPFRVVVDISRTGETVSSAAPRSDAAPSPTVSRADATTPSIAPKPEPAASSTVPATNPAPVIPDPAAKIAPLGQKVHPQVTNFIWANHLDIMTGEVKTRMVLDVSSDKVTADSILISVPQPRIIVNIKGADVGKIKQATELDGSIVDRVELSSLGNNTAQMVIDLPVMVQAADYKVFTLPNNPEANRPFRVVVDVKKPQTLQYNVKPGLKGKVIVLDPGHGGQDPGAIGLNKTYEKTVTLAVAKEVQALLEKAGAKVIMTRTTDKDVANQAANDYHELAARTAIGNASKADIFVSIHANAFVRREAGGTQTFYFPKSQYDSLLAKNLQEGMVQAGGLQDRGIRQAGFFVVKRSVMPAALVELAFISNPKEEQLLVNPQFQKKMALGITQGIERFFQQASKLGGDDKR